MDRSLFTLKTVNQHALAEDGLRICVVVPEEGSIRTIEDLQEILVLGNLQTIILVQRQDIAQEFMHAVAEDAFDGHEPTQRDWHDRWNESGGVIATNAMPHIHDYTNCHVVPQPSECSTSFFVRGAVIEAARDVANDRTYPIELRTQLHSAIEKADENTTDAFFEELHAIHPTRKGWLPVLQCVQQMQQRIQALGGMHQVNRGIDGYGLVAIPPRSVHGRTVINQMVRQERTAWRYFGKAVEKKS